MEYYKRCDFTVTEWKTRIDHLIQLGIDKYQSDWNLDIRSNTKIYKREIIRSNRLLVFRENDVIGGFLCILTNKITNCLYITLLVSLYKGNGRKMLEFIASNDEPHSYVIVRSPFETVGFYTRLGFNICNWNTLLARYTSGDVDVMLTQIVQVKPYIEILIQRGWISPGSTEYPLIALRHVQGKDVGSTRQSKRIRSKRAHSIAEIRGN